MVRGHGACAARPLFRKERHRHAGQETCAPPVIMTLPAQINAATAEQAAGQISAAFTPGVTVVIADLTCD